VKNRRQTALVRPRTRPRASQGKFSRTTQISNGLMKARVPRKAYVRQPAVPAKDFGPGWLVPGGTTIVGKPLLTPATLGISPAALNTTMSPNTEARPPTFRYCAHFSGMFRATRTDHRAGGGMRSPPGVLGGYISHAGIPNRAWNHRYAARPAAGKRTGTCPPDRHSTPEASDSNRRPAPGS